MKAVTTLAGAIFWNALPASLSARTTVRQAMRPENRLRPTEPRPRMVDQTPSAPTSSAPAISVTLPCRSIEAVTPRM